VNVDLGIWSKLTKIVVALLLVVGLLGLGRLYIPLIRHNENLRREHDRLGAEIQKQEIAAKQLRLDIESMRDPKAVERLARERLGYARPDETVVVFESPATNTPAP
jgi:cell division protein FtsL